MFDALPLIAQYLPAILRGFVLTVEIAVASVLLSVLLGFAGAAMRLSGHALLARAGQAYSVLVRGVPDLIWMLMIYYSLQLVLNDATDALGWEMIEISPFAAGIFTLSFIYGAYFTETFRGAMLAIAPGQIEAACAYGMGNLQTLRRITFPLMMRFALPGIKNNWLVLTKSTALVSIIGLEDMTRLAQQAGSSTHLPFAFNLVSALLFLLITSVSLQLFRWLETHYQRGVKMTVHGDE